MGDHRVKIALYSTQICVFLSQPVRWDKAGALMRYDEFKDALATAGLSVREFAEHLGVSAGTVTNYASRVRVPLHFAVVATLMAEMKQSGLDFRSPLSRIERDKPRAAGSPSTQRVQQSLFSEPPSEE